LDFRISEIEFAKLAEQLNSRLQVDPAHESVDLDNLFAFLSDVQSGRTIDSVGDRMKEIVSDFDEVICTRFISSDTLIYTSYDHVFIWLTLFSLVMIQFSFSLKVIYCRVENLSYHLLGTKMYMVLCYAGEENIFTTYVRLTKEVGYCFSI